MKNIIKKGPMTKGNRMANAVRKPTRIFTGLLIFMSMLQCIGYSPSSHPYFTDSRTARDVPFVIEPVIFQRGMI
jgi:hypothetical protein